MQGSGDRSRAGGVRGKEAEAQACVERTPRAEEGVKGKEQQARRPRREFAGAGTEVCREKGGTGRLPCAQ